MLPPGPRLQGLVGAAEAVAAVPPDIAKAPVIAQIPTNRLKLRIKAIPSSDAGRRQAMTCAGSTCYRDVARELRIRDRATTPRPPRARLTGAAAHRSSARGRGARLRSPSPP